ncbi:serine hydrolase domain-containing protein [Saccharospirillum mangrovi]|uniref:serine hydrolase domain-containing protein n=1 Tax=Saccharospirillum mangrovi TaxID=2161747 RepID=UPI000D33B3D8|nr:serine hydrolase domain-containing protein [Saccharospirillum mangrovi]
MRDLKGIFGILAATTLLAACQSTPSHPSAEIDQTAQDVMQRYAVPGLALARIEDGELLWTRSYGQADADQPLTADTIFNVASLTKPLFSLGYLHQVEAGRADLDAPLADDWIDPDVADDPRLPQLTARLALSHQSGFPNWRGRDGLFFMFAPGERHEYSGEGYEYVRRALESQTGESMSAWMQRDVLKPAGMNDTVFGWDDRLNGRVSAGYDEAGHTVELTSHTREPNAAANTFTTIGDYGRFAAWVARGADLDPALFAQMITPQSAHPDPLEFWGLGWRLTQMPDRTLIEHDGREPGIRTLVIIDPSNGDGLVMLTNSSNGELIVRDLLKATWPDADAVLAQRDRDTWHYLSALPAPALPGLLGFIAQSPSFSMKLLYAAKAGLIDEAGLSAAELAKADATLSALVETQFDGEVSPDTLRELFMQLGTPTEQGFAFAEALSADQARNWLDSAATLADAR